MKLKILLTLWGLLPFLGGCTAEQSMEEAIAEARNPAPVRQNLSLGDIISGAAQDASQLAGAYARGYSEGYSNYQPTLNQWHSGIIMGPPGTGLGTYNFGPGGGTIELPREGGPPSPNGPSLMDRTITVMGN
jgi:hypothetical protein